MFRHVVPLMTALAFVAAVLSPAVAQDVSPENIVSYVVQLPADSTGVSFQLPINVILREVYSNDGILQYDYQRTAVYSIFENGELKLEIRSKCYAGLSGTNDIAWAWLEFKSDLGIPLNGGSTIRVEVSDGGGYPGVGAITLIGYRY